MEFKIVVSPETIGTINNTIKRIVKFSGGYNDEELMSVVEEQCCEDLDINCKIEYEDVRHSPLIIDPIEYRKENVPTTRLLFGLEPSDVIKIIRARDKNDSFPFIGKAGIERILFDHVRERENESGLVLEHSYEDPFYGYWIEVASKLINQVRVYINEQIPEIDDSENSKKRKTQN